MYILKFLFKILEIKTSNKERENEIANRNLDILLSGQKTYPGKRNRAVFILSRHWRGWRAKQLEYPELDRRLRFSYFWHSLYILWRSWYFDLTFLRWESQMSSLRLFRDEQMQRGDFAWLLQSRMHPTDRVWQRVACEFARLQTGYPVSLFNSHSNPVRENSMKGRLWSKSGGKGGRENERKTALDSGLHLHLAMLNFLSTLSSPTVRDRKFVPFVKRISIPRRHQVFASSATSSTAISCI